MEGLGTSVTRYKNRRPDKRLCFYLGIKFFKPTHRYAYTDMSEREREKERLQGQTD